MKKIGNVFAVLGIILMIWIFISFIDINTHNSPFENDYQSYLSWNFFIIFFGG
jgi:hypothetical protein